MCSTGIKRMSKEIVSACIAQVDCDRGINGSDVHQNRVTVCFHGNQRQRDYTKPANVNVEPLHFSCDQCAATAAGVSIFARRSRRRRALSSGMVKRNSRLELPCVWISGG